jgi:hypothetical protein
MKHLFAARTRHSVAPDDLPNSGLFWHQVDGACSQGSELVAQGQAARSLQALGI